ncbi:TetR family transcriptional regulator [Arthrobacter sp.]|uniref:TetR family transcriptional regulator n=1 Tax=Arthrobacter sp. TaxID=1667 RepID=UPI0028A195CE|nr:TetR family transcriptional regulator [Arthrobacter sp.]
MFAPGASIAEIEQDVEDMIVELVHRLGDLADADPDPVGAQERAYIRAFSDVRANSSLDQAALLATAVGRPNLAESLLYLNRRLDRANLSPRDPAGIIGVVIRLAMDGLWVSDILDSSRFTPAERSRITKVLTSLSRLSDERMEELLPEQVAAR